MLKKFLCDPSLIVPTENVGIKDSLSYEEILVQILGHQVCNFITKEATSVNIIWRNQFTKQVTWEAEQDM